MISVAMGISHAARADESVDDALETIWTRPQLLPDWGDYRARLDASDISFEIVYTGDFISNTRGGLARKSEYLGNLDLTLTWHTETLLGRDLGTFFVYGLWDHGGRPSDNVGDAQGVDNIEAPDSAKIFEAWWQKSLFDTRASLLLGLYDVNSEFYAVDSAEMFMHSSFGIGGELGTSGINGPSIFPTAALGVRFKAEVTSEVEFQAALLDGVPGDPRRPKGTRIRLSEDDGAFFIAEVAHHRKSMDEDEAATSRPAQRRRVGRTWSERPDFSRIALGTWLYTAKQDHLSRTEVNGDPSKVRGHPGVYLIADRDVRHLSPLGSGGVSVFAQLGWADGDVGQFAGYTGAGIMFTGLIPSRGADECGFAAAAAYNGKTFRRAIRNQGDDPAVAEINLEWTYRAVLTPWLSLQGDLQYIINPGGLRNRSDALVAGLRYVLSL